MRLYPRVYRNTKINTPTHAAAGERRFYPGIFGDYTRHSSFKPRGDFNDGARKVYRLNNPWINAGTVNCFNNNVQ
jgi:DNA primase catalytic subunit